MHVTIPLHTRLHRESNWCLALIENAPAIAPELHQLALALSKYAVELETTAGSPPPVTDPGFGRRGPTIDMHPTCDGSSSRFARPPRAPATLPPYIRLPARHRRSWRLPVVLAAFVAAMFLATFILPGIFGNATGNVSRPLLVNFLPSPCNQLSSVTGPEIE